MILVDTTVLIDYFRTRDAKLLSVMQKNDASICGIVRAEILCGTQNPSHRRRLILALDAFGQLLIPEDFWEIVGDNLAVLRANGITAPFTDVTIATVAIENDVEVWARDAHFPMMQIGLSRLRLFQEPP